MFQGSGSPPMAPTNAGASVLNTSTDSNPDDDPNNSIIKKVRSRVSSIIPDALSKWFSPAAVKRPRESEPPAVAVSPAVVAVSGRNGNLLRDRFGDGAEQPELVEDDESEVPPNRKKKRLEDRFNTSLGDFNDDLSALPGPSGLNISAIDRRSSLPMSSQLPRSGRNAFSSSTPSTSPQSAAAGGLFHRQQQQQQQKTSLIGHTNRTTVPYNFGTTTTAAAAASAIDEESEELIGEIEGGFSNSIRHRRSIREVSGRKRLNIPQTAVDRSISEPPAPIFGGKTMFGRFTAHPQQQHQQLQEELSDERRDETDVLVSNGTVNESASESSSVSNLNLSQSDQIEVGGSRRLSGFMGNVSRSKRMKVGGSTGDLCFSSHLETEKSLFSAKNSGRVGGVGGRPTFNASLYGSSSSLGSSNSSLFANSPFYNGKTMYGGASAYSARRDIRQKALRVPVQMRPASALSNFSSSNASLASDTSALSNTAKRILEIMNQCSGPLSEARKLGSSLSLNSTLASAKVPGLVQARKRFNEEDLNINRSIRMSSPRTPYSRPQSAATSASTSSKPPTSELQIPSISQLLHMKRLQTNTESVRRLATESLGGAGGGSILNEPTEYKLPEPADDSNNNVHAAKHTNKIRSKLNRVREESAADRSSLHNPVPQLVLPEVTLAGLKSVPKFDIKVPAAAAASSAATTTNGSNKNGETAPWKSTVAAAGKEDSTTQKTNAISSSNNSATTMKIAASTATSLPPVSKVNSSVAYKFSSPTKLNLSDSGLSLTNAKSSSTLNNFKFSNPEPLGSASAAAPSKLAGFQFNPETAKPKPMAAVAAASVGTASPVKAPLPLKSGSCLDALKSATSGPVPELKSGSCLQALAPSTTTKPAADFGNAFKLTGSNKWECEACMVRNDPDKAKCVACESPKPGAKAAKPTAKTPLTTTTTTTADAGFKALVAQQSARWECSDCMTRNDADKLKCVCCNSSKPGAAPAAAALAVAASVPAAIKSMFAAPADQGFKSLVAQQSAGKWECSACMTRNEATRSKCACCEQAKPGSTPADAPSFSFGSSKSAAPSSGFSFGVPQTADTNKDAPKSGFSFGVPASSSSSSATPSGGFTFGNAAATASAPSSDDKPKFSFGSGASSTKSPAPTGFSFGSKPVATSDTTDSSKTSEKKEEPAKPATTTGFGSGGFSFGAKPATESVKPDTVTSSSGGFSFGSPAQAATKPTTTTSAAASPISTSTEQKKPITFGTGSSSSSPAFSFGSTKPAAASSETKPATTNVAPASGMFSFGSPKPAGVAAGATTESKDSGASSSVAAAPAAATSVPIFGGAQKPAGPSITPGFSFSSSSSATAAAPAATSSAASTPANSSASATVSAPSFSFGSSAKPAEPAKPTTTTLGSAASTSFVFGQSSQPAAKVVPSFGSATAAAASSSAITSATTTADKPAVATFGSFGASTFGAATANATSTSAFSFAGSASKPTETSSPAFSFGAKPTQTPAATSAPVFGSPATAPVTAKSVFGSPAASTTSSTFGSFGGAAATTGSNTATPTFGSSSFGVASPVAATGSGSGPIFGQSTGPAPAFGSASAGFGGIASGSPFGAAAAVTASADEPQSKKVFEFGSSSAVGNSQPAATPFQFGSGSNNNNNNNNDNGHKPFSFSAHSTPNFNFTAGSNAGQTAAPVVAAPTFQFGAAPTMPQQNPFAATSIPGQTQLQQQRRKISARRRMTPR